MITLDKLISDLLKLKNKGYGKLPIIYSSDDEGNSFQKVENAPSVFLVENLEERELEPSFKQAKNGGIVDFIQRSVKPIHHVVWGRGKRPFLYLLFKQF